MDQIELKTNITQKTQRNKMEEYLQFPKISKKDIGQYLEIDGQELDDLWETLDTNYTNIDDTIWYYIEEVRQEMNEKEE